MVNARFHATRQPGVNARYDKNPRWVTGCAIVQRKVFRAEQMFGGRRAKAPQAPDNGERDAFDQLEPLRALGTRPDLADGEVARELAHMREAVARNRAELSALIGGSKTRRMTRAAGELGAAVDGMEKATHKILQAAEAIDDNARALGSALKSEFERGLAQDIQDHTMAIYEACNFQDVAGQRIAKVIGIMTAVEEQLAAMLARYGALVGPAEPAALAEPAENDRLLNGPKLDGDCGHASQRDIDALFG
jgi:chemotaxis protein CheZ